jgi:acyl carrier protein
MSDITDTLRGFLEENVLFGEGTVTDDQELIGGILDSLALLQFVEFVESEYGFEVGDADMVPANFQSLSAVERYISSRS